MDIAEEGTEDENGKRLPETGVMDVEEGSLSSCGWEGIL